MGDLPNVFRDAAASARMCGRFTQQHAWAEIRAIWGPIGPTRNQSHAPSRRQRGVNLQVRTNWCAAAIDPAGTVGDIAPPSVDVPESCDLNGGVDALYADLNLDNVVHATAFVPLLRRTHDDHRDLRARL
jgi:hypothetical protein